MDKKIVILIIGILTLGCSSSPRETNRVEQSMRELDRLIPQKEHYVALRRDRIARLSAKALATASPEEQLDAYNGLYDEYKSYIYDSAFVYATRALEVADRTSGGRSDNTIIARCKIAFCYLSSGLFREAFDTMASIDIKGASDESRLAYYSLMGRLYCDMADYSRGATLSADYTARGIEYYDSVILHSPAASAEMWSTVGFKRMQQRLFPAAIDAFQTLLGAYEPVDDHTYAIATSCMGYIYWQMGDDEKALYYLSQAAIGDIRSATTEGVAMMNLATLLYQRGEVKKANRYIRLAMEDANFYNARHRKMQISAVLPIVEKEHALVAERQRNNLAVLGVILLMLCALLLAATIIIYKQVKRLRKARGTIQRQNKNLKLTNGKLLEASEIKDEYIAQSLYVKAEYIERLENLYRTINRKLSARQFDDIHSYLKESDLKKERENMCSSFDETFLKLFPGFIEGYNELFRPEDRTTLDSSRRLTPELRIFALVRLGIRESDRIAKFLGYSENTINTYKTKIKNRSTVPNEQFEQRIMAIKTVRRTH